MRLIVPHLLFFCLISLNAIGQTYNWLLIYYMPYDNNLSPLSQTIISQIKEAPVGKKVAVVLQTDLADRTGIHRYVFTDQIDSVKVDSEEMALTQSLDEYLTWVSDHFRARHYAVILLNHGGGLMEYGLDEYPSIRWMSIDSIASSIGKFNKRAKIKRLDLLFEQVCARATVENLYEFREVAAYTLASQGLVPAPGYYYPEMLKQLALGNIDSGKELSDIIVAAERQDMYYSFSLIDNSRWNNWTSALANYTQELGRVKPAINKSALKVYSYGGEAYYDFTSVLKATTATPSLNIANNQVIEATNSKLVARYYKNEASEQMNGYSGLSLYSPFRYRPNSLSIYRNKDYSAFIRTLESLSRSGR